MQRWQIGFAGAGLAALGLGWQAWRMRRAPAPYPASAAWSLDNPLSVRLLGTRGTLDRLALVPGQRVLEVGVGSGRLLLPAGEDGRSGGAVTGLDRSPAMIARLRSRAARARLHNLTSAVGDATALPFAPGSFGLIILCAVLGEIPDRAAALAECRRVLAPAGRVVVEEGLFDPHHQTREAVCDLAREAGLRTVALVGGRLHYAATLVAAA